MRRISRISNNISCGGRGGRGRRGREEGEEQEGQEQGQERLVDDLDHVVERAVGNSRQKKTSRTKYNLFISLLCS